MTLIPFVLICFVMLPVWGVRLHLLRQKRDSTEDPSLSDMINELRLKGLTVGRAFLIIIFFYTPVSRTVLDAFKCRIYEPINSVDGNWESSNRGFLDADASVDCNSSPHFSLTNFAMLMVFVYPLGTPSMFMILMLKNRMRIYEGAALLTYGIVYFEYKQFFFLWGIWDLFRRLACSGMLIFFQAGSAVQYGVGFFVSLVSLVLHLSAKPYVAASGNFLQGLCMFALTNMFVSGLVRLASTSANVNVNDANDYAGVWVWATSVSFVVLMACSIISRTRFGALLLNNVQRLLAVRNPQTIFYGSLLVIACFIDCKLEMIMTTSGC